MVFGCAYRVIALRHQIPDHLRRQGGTSTAWTQSLKRAHTRIYPMRGCTWAHLRMANSQIHTFKASPAFPPDTRPHPTIKHVSPWPCNYWPWINENRLKNEIRPLSSNRKIEFYLTRSRSKFFAVEMREKKNDVKRHESHLHSKTYENITGESRNRAYPSIQYFLHFI